MVIFLFADSQCSPTLLPVISSQTQDAVHLQGGHRGHGHPRHGPRPRDSGPPQGGRGDQLRHPSGEASSAHIRC